MKFWIITTIISTVMFIGITGFSVSQTDRIENLESVIARADSLVTYKQIVAQKDGAIRAWQSTAYHMISFNAGEIEADSMVAVLQANFKPGSAIIDLWLRSTKEAE